MVTIIGFKGLIRIFNTFCSGLLTLINYHHILSSWIIFDDMMSIWIIAFNIVLIVRWFSCISKLHYFLYSLAVNILILLDEFYPDVTNILDSIIVILRIRAFLFLFIWCSWTVNHFNDFGLSFLTTASNWLFIAIKISRYCLLVRIAIWIWIKHLVIFISVADFISSLTA